MSFGPRIVGGWKRMVGHPMPGAKLGWFLFTLTLGMFLGSWQQAQFEAEAHGASLSWASHAVFLAPVVGMLAWLARWAWRGRRSAVSA